MGPGRWATCVRTARCMRRCSCEDPTPCRSSQQKGWSVAFWPNRWCTFTQHEMIEAFGRPASFCVTLVLEALTFTGAASWGLRRCVHQAASKPRLHFHISCPAGGNLRQDSENLGIYTSFVGFFHSSPFTAMKTVPVFGQKLRSQKIAAWVRHLKAARLSSATWFGNS